MATDTIDGLVVQVLAKLFDPPFSVEEVQKVATKLPVAAQHEHAKLQELQNENHRLKSMNGSLKSDVESLRRNAAQQAQQFSFNFPPPQNGPPNAEIQRLNSLSGKHRKEITFLTASNTKLKADAAESRNANSRARAEADQLRSLNRDLTAEIQRLRRDMEEIRRKGKHADSVNPAASLQPAKDINSAKTTIPVNPTRASWPTTAGINQSQAIKATVVNAKPNLGFHRATRSPPQDPRARPPADKTQDAAPSTSQYLTTEPAITVNSTHIEEAPSTPIVNLQSRLSPAHDPDLEVNAISGSCKKRAASEEVNYSASKKRATENDVNVTVDRKRAASEEVIQSPGKKIKLEGDENVDKGNSESVVAENGDDSNTKSTRDSKPICQTCRESNLQCDHQSRCNVCISFNQSCVYTPCPLDTSCNDASCAYIHSDQWSLWDTPRWCVKGITTFRENTKPTPHSHKLAMMHELLEGGNGSPAALVNGNDTAPSADLNEPEHDGAHTMWPTALLRYDESDMD